MFWRLSFYRGGPVLMSAISGIDIALWDLKARRLNVPIHQLLGGKLRSKVAVYPWIGGDRPGDVEAAGKSRLAQGFKADHEKVGGIRAKVCQVAAQATKMEAQARAQAQNGGGSGGLLGGPGLTGQFRMPQGAL